MQDARLKIVGLHTNPNIYSEVPQGALSQADNIVIDREGVANPRRGFDSLTGSFGSASHRATVVTEYQNKLISHYTANKLAYYNASTWTDLSGTYTAPTTQRMRFVQASQNLYFTTSTGAKKMDSYSATPSGMGVPKAIHLTASLSLSGTAWFAVDQQVAYRVIWGIRDANNNVIYGAPSQRVELTNPAAGSTKSVSLDVYIPSGITTSHFMQIYRSRMSGSDDTTASDELFLVYEASPSAGEITAGVKTAIIDETPESLLGATLYTSPGQDGILQGNDQPPLANDIAVFNDFMFFANTTTKYRFYLNLLGVAGTAGLANNDTVTIAAVYYKAVTAAPNNVGKTGLVGAPYEFQLVTGGSAAQNVADTARNLVALINTVSGNTLVYAYYLSSADDLPGKLLIEERGIGGSVFTVQVSRASAWSPEGLDVAQNATNDAWVNGLFYSKFQQPEAVPLVNYLRVGSANDPILRIVSLRDSLFIFKQTEGIFRLTGDNANNFSVALFDSSTRLLAPNSLAVLNNQIYGLFDQGVCSVAETGVRVASRQIENSILALLGSALEEVKSLAWAIGYESDRKYIIHLPELDGDTATSQAYVYNTFTNAWTRWVRSDNCGFIRPSDNLMYVARATTNSFSVERKLYTFKDHADEPLLRTITDITGLALTVDDETNVEVGDVVYQSESVYAIVLSVTDQVVTVGYDPGFSEAACEIRKGYECVVQWQPFSAGNPMLKKQWREASLLFEKRPRTASLTFSSEVVATEVSVSINSYAGGEFGTFPWGAEPWGGSAREKIIRTYVSRQHQRATTLNVTWTHQNAYSNFALNGAQIVWNPYSGPERSTR